MLEAFSLFPYFIYMNRQRKRTLLEMQLWTEFFLLEKELECTSYKRQQWQFPLVWKITHINKYFGSQQFNKKIRGSKLNTSLQQFFQKNDEQLKESIKCQCWPHIETSKLIYYANQVTGFYITATMAFKVIKIPE